MKMIVAVDRKWGIGKNNKLLFSIKEDMKFFKETTTGKIVVMGRKTYESLPNPPLPNRVNIVLSSTDVFGCITAHDVDELFELISQFDDNDVFIIGGARMYETMLPYCDIVYVTKVDDVGDADTFFTNLDERDNWQLVKERKTNDSGYDISFCEYKNEKPMEYKL